MYRSKINILHNKSPLNHQFGLFRQNSSICGILNSITNLNIIMHNETFKCANKQIIFNMILIGALLAD